MPKIKNKKPSNLSLKKSPHFKKPKQTKTDCLEKKESHYNQLISKQANQKTKPPTNPEKKSSQKTCTWVK
jgi:hypothetical protein